MSVNVKIKDPCEEGWDSQKFHSNHNGIDIGWLKDYSSDGRTAILACDDGEVVFEGFYPEKIKVNGVVNTYKPIGVIIKHNWSDEYDHYSIYWHLSNTTINKGDKVTKGQRIGTKGNTGYCGAAGGVHLHFQIIELPKGMELPQSYAWTQYSIDPAPLIEVYDDQIFKYTGNYNLAKHSEEEATPMAEKCIKITPDDNYDYRWVVVGSQYGSKDQVRSMGAFKSTSLLNDGWEEVIATNGGLFYQYDGNYFANGLEKCEGVVTQDVNMTAVSDYNKAVTLATDTNGKIFIEKQSNIIANLDAYNSAVTGMCVLYNGRNVTNGRTEFKTQWNQISGRTMIGFDKNGNYMVYTVTGTTGKTGYTGAQMVTIAQNKGFYSAILLDGGGSVWCRYENDIVNQTTRQVKNAVILYRKKKTEPTEDFEKLYLEKCEQYNTLAAEKTALEKKYENLRTTCTVAKLQLEEGLK